jgi:hypothetical protein
MADVKREGGPADARLSRGAARAWSVGNAQERGGQEAVDQRGRGGPVESVELAQQSGRGGFVEPEEPMERSGGWGPDEQSRRGQHGETRGPRQPVEQRGRGT